MITTAQLRTKRPIVLNQSAIKTFINCKRLYAWEYFQNLQPVGRRSVLAIGTAAHAGLAVFHSGGIKAPEPLPAAATADQKAEHSALTRIATLPPVEQAQTIARLTLRKEAGAVSTFEDKSVEEAQDILDRVFPAYVEYWKKYDALWKPLNQEIQFLVRVGDDSFNIWLRGRADNLSVAKGGLYLVDYKTAGRMDPRDLLKYEMDFQLSAYIYGLTKHLTEQSLKEGGEPVYIRGAIIDVLVKTQTPQFARELYTRSDQELQEFEDEFIEVASDIRARQERVAAGEDWKIVFHRNTEHCFRYGTCAFRDVCQSDTPTRRALYDAREPNYVDKSQQELLKAWEKENA